MTDTIKNYNIDVIKQEGTGSHDSFEDSKVIQYKIGNFLISIRLTSTNEFLGIEEIGYNRDFLSLQQKIALKGYHDVEEFYDE